MNTQTNQTAVNNIQSVNKETAMNTNNTTLNTNTIIEVNPMDNFNLESIDTNSGNTVSINLDDIMLFNTDGFLPQDALIELELKKRLAELNTNKVVVRNIEKAISLTRTIHIIRNMGDLNELRNHFIFAALEYSSYWKNIKRTDAKKLTYGRIIYNDLLKVTSADSLAVRSFVEASKWLHDTFTLDTVEGKETIVKPRTEVSVKILRTGVGVSVEHGTTITPTNSNKPFVFKNKTSGIYNTETLNPHLINVLKNIHIHNEFKVQDSGPFGREYIAYRKDRLTFRKADILGMLLILKENKIDISELFEAQVKGEVKSLVLVRKEDGKLERMYVPAHTFSEIYGNTGVVSLTEARQGYVAPKVSIPRLVEFVQANGEDYVITRENVNKTINRADKLHDKDGWKTESTKIIVINDSTVSETINNMFLTGNIFLPTSWILKHGVCRVITDMDEGGIKSATSITSEIDKELDDLNYGVVGASAFKGGILSAIGLAKGDTNFIQNLSNLVQESKNSTLVIQKIISILNSELKTFVIAGEEVQGIEINVPLTITNAYTVESVMLNDKFEAKEAEVIDLPDMDKVQKNLDNLESEIETGRRSINGLRDSVMDRVIKEADFTVGEWLEKGLESGELKYKPAVTRIIAPEIQSIAVWHGKDVALEYLRGLLNSQAKSMDADKVYAAQWISGNIDLEYIVSAEKIARLLKETMSEEGMEIKTGSSLYPYPVVKTIANLFEVQDDFGWVGIEYPNGDVVAMPCGFIFKNDFDTVTDTTSYVVTKGLLNELLENIKGMMKEDGTIFEGTVDSKYMEATIQRPLLGKNFGYQYTTGMYGVMLPLFGNYSKHDVALTNRGRLKQSNRAYELMNGAKPPQLFRDATAGYRVFSKTFNNSKLDAIFTCAIFITAEATMIMQNDHDGDLFRLSVDLYVLPLFTGPADSFNGKFFTDFLAEELEGNKLKIKQSNLVTMREFHSEIFSAVEAKGKVGQYTANKYFFEAALSNVRDFEGTDGELYTINSYDTYVITSILSQLVQMEAMDNIKQDGSSEFITDLALFWKLSRIKGYNGMTEEEAMEIHIEKLASKLLALSDKFDMSLSTADITKYVQALVYASLNFNRDNMPAYSLMNARIIETRNFSDITNSVTVEGYEYTGSYNYFNSLDRIEESADTESMYYHIVKETVDIIFN